MPEAGSLGKKVLFLYPPPVLTDIVEELSYKEFEVYLVKDAVKAKRFLMQEPDSIVFINHDDGLDEQGWEAWVRGIREGENTSHVGIGVLSLNEDQVLKEKYLMDLQVACGCITLKIGAAKTMEILAKTLEANEARGRRKFVRAMTPPKMAQCVASFNEGNIRGDISDFSIAGMACSFEGGPNLKPGAILRSCQLTIKGGRLNVDGVVVAHRGARKSEDGSPLAASTVVMFDPGSLDESKRDKLHSLVFRVNQHNMERLFETL